MQDEDALRLAQLRRYDGKPWPNMDFYDVVRLNDRAPEEARGKLGYVTGWAPDSEPPGVGVWIYDLQAVWHLEADAVDPLGHKDDIAANQSKGFAVRVNQDGEAL